MAESPYASPVRVFLRCLLRVVSVHVEYNALLPTISVQFFHPLVILPPELALPQAALIRRTGTGDRL
jgi:hypothetical protein